MKVETSSKRKPKFNPVREMPKLNPEPNYIIRTRPPMWGKRSSCLS